jgi:hypothetical protein
VGAPPLPEFGTVALAIPVATVLHVVEEWPGFPRWARRFASPHYSDREYVVTHAATIAIAVTVALVLRTYPHRAVVGLAFAFVVAPACLWNACFHAAATIRSRRYCPGALTGLALYVPLFALLGVQAMRAGLLGWPALVAATVAGGAFHALEVGHTVFKRW